MSEEARAQPVGIEAYCDHNRPASGPETDRRYTNGIRDELALGEATVLFCAILGTLAILRKTARKRREEVDRETDAV